jgi:uncharacterized membrane protein required for colicin V production
MANAVFAIIMLYSFIAGARRGFYKEVVHALALVVSVYVTKEFSAAAGQKLVTMSGGKLPLILGEVGAGIALWVLSFLVAAVAGRLILKKLRGKGVDDNLDEGAEAIADLIGGDTTKGPVTLLTDPIASKTGIFYWTDKILGAGLGLAKGLITCLMLFGIIKIVSSLGHLNEIGDECSEEPWRFAELVNHPELRGLANHPKLKELVEDDQVMADWRAGNLKGLLFNEKVRALLSDADLRQRMAEIDWSKVHADVQAADKESTLKKLIPDGKGGSLPVPTGEPS